MKYNFYSKDEIKIRVGVYVGLVLIESLYPLIGGEPLQDRVIKSLLMLIAGLGAVWLMYFCDTKAARQIEIIEGQSEKDYVSKRTCINIKHNICYSFIFVSLTYLFMYISGAVSGAVIEFKITEELNFGHIHYVIFTPIAMLATAGITYLYFRIRFLSRNRQ